MRQRFKFRLATLLMLALAHQSIAAVHVEPTTLLINQSFEIAAGTYRYFDLRLDATTSLTVTISVEDWPGNDINTWLVDLTNYQRLQERQQFSYSSGRPMVVRFGKQSRSAQQALRRYRHAVSPQRARNIVAWLNVDEDIERRWLRLLAPRMTTEALEALVAGQNDPKEKAIAREELARRE